MAWSGRVRTSIDRHTIDASAHVYFSGRRRRFPKPFARLHLRLGEGAVGFLPDPVDIETEEEISHGGVARHDELVNRMRINRK